MDVNVWLGGNNNIFSSVNKNIFSLSLAQWRVSSAHGCLIQVTKGVVWWHQQQPPWWPGATLGSQHQMQSSHFYITQTAFSLHTQHNIPLCIIEEIFIKYYSSDGGLWLVIHVMYPRKWCVEAWAAVSSELHCAESESGDTGAMVELVLVEPVDPTFIHDSARLQLRLQQLLRGRGYVTTEERGPDSDSARICLASEQILIDKMEWWKGWPRLCGAVIAAVPTIRSNNSSGH